MIAVAAQAAAARLGGGSAPEVPVVRIVLAFVLCAAIALLAILLVRQRIGAGRGARRATRGWWRGVASGAATVDVQEVRRLTLHADIGVVRHGGREYLLLVQAGSAVVLRERDVAEQAA